MFTFMYESKIAASTYLLIITGLVASSGRRTVAMSANGDELGASCGRTTVKAR